MLQIIKSVEHNYASTLGMCVTAHVCWEVHNGGYECYLYASKTCAAPLKKETIPFVKMQSAVLSRRLWKSITIHSKFQFEKVVHVLDSKCTLATLYKKNISDLCTRTNAGVADVAEKSD